MFSVNIENKINKAFEKVVPLLQKMYPHYLDKIEEYNEDISILLKFYYAYMPVEDMSTYPFYYFERYAISMADLYYDKFINKHILYDDKDKYDSMFLNYVAFHRSNNEELYFARDKFKFVGEQKEKIDALDDYDAVKEINYWASEYVTYRAGDERTASALTTFKNGIGRCGEESVFLVEVLRANGFIARQVYVPYWSHCDDNHAWVEVYVDGHWYYLGACEPEPILDKGWFSAASRRAPIVRAMVFTDLIEDEEIIGNNGYAKFINVTTYYTKTRKLDIKVVDEYGIPVNNCDVYFRVINYCSYKTIASKMTDNDGMVSINIGYGTLNVRIFKNGIYTDYTVGENDEYRQFVLKNDDSQSVKDIDFIVAKDNYELKIKENSNLQCYKDENIKKQQCVKVREERVSKRLEEAVEKYEQYIKNIKSSSKFEQQVSAYSIKDFYIKAAANIDNLENFLYENEVYSDFELKLAILKTLSDKDFRDFDCECLYSHLNHMKKFRNEFSFEVFVKGLLPIRIENESLSDFAPKIYDFLSDDLKAKFIENAISIVDYVDNIIDDTDDSYNFYPYLYMLPESVIKHNVLTKKDREFIIVAVARAVGVPAYLRKFDREVMLFIDGEFRCVSGDSKHDIKLLFESDKELSYDSDFSICNVGEKEDMVLNFTHFDFSNEVKLNSGYYKVISYTRLPNGDSLVRERLFNSSEISEILIEKRSYELEDMLVDYSLPEVYVFDKKGEQVILKDVLKSDVNLVFWLKSSSEPSEHIYDEIKAMGEIREDVIVISDSISEHEKLSQISNHVYYDFDSDNINMLARLTYVLADTYPLAFVIGDKGKVRFVSCGYNVGIVDIMNNIKGII